MGKVSLQGLLAHDPRITRGISFQFENLLHVRFLPVARALRKEHGVTAAGVRRGETINNNPDAQTTLLAGDIVYLLSTQEALTKAAWLFHTAAEGSAA